jgi:predicted MFS family arabinose efflux permease
MHPEESATGAPPPLTRSQIFLLLILAAVQFTHVLDFMIVMPLGPQYMAEMGLDPQQFAWMVSAYTFSACLSGLLAAWFVDRFDRKNALLLLYAGFTFGTLLCAFAPNYWLLVLARTVAGAFGGVVASTVLAIVGDVFPEARRGMATGVVMSAFSVAMIAGLPAGILLAGWGGCPLPFEVLGGLSAAVLLLAYWALPPLRHHLHHQHTAAITMWEVFSRPRHLRAYMLTLALVVSGFMVGPFVAAYLVKNVGLQQAQLGLVYLLGGATTLGSLTAVGWIADRFGKLPVFRVCALVAIIPTIWLANLPRVSLPAALALTTFFMVATSARMVPAMAMITASAAARYRGSFMSINASVQHMGSGLAALVAGYIVGETPEGALTNYHIVGFAAAGAMLVSVFVAGRLRSAEGDLVSSSPPMPHAAPEAEAVSVEPAA